MYVYNHLFDQLSHNIAPTLETRLLPFDTNEWSMWSTFRSSRALIFTCHPQRTPWYFIKSAGYFFPSPNPSTNERYFGMKKCKQPTYFLIFQIFQSPQYYYLVVKPFWFFINDGSNKNWFNHGLTKNMVLHLHRTVNVPSF